METSPRRAGGPVDEAAATGEARPQRIVVAVPCYNEAATIGKVIADFRRALPESEIHVFDNSSADGTAEAAVRAGAVVHYVARRGKGEVVRAIFREIDADVLLMVDGDDTYPADRARALVDPVARGRADMVVATRRGEEHAFRPMHVFGNRLVARAINALFDTRLSDVLTGYRAFSRRFVKTMPVLSRGFEIETEITLHALEHGHPISEVEMPYRARPAGSVSKLSTLQDGRRVLTLLLRLYKDYRPMTFFGLPGLLALALGVVAGTLVIGEFVESGRVTGIARAVFSVACCLIGIVSLATGLILDTVNRRARELYVLLADHVLDDRGRRR
jgi:glycosyltransferase involved in cell wall biosynthesis